MSKQTRDLLRQQYVEMIKDCLIARGEEVLIVGSNELAIPCVDAEGNDEYCVFKVQVPTGSRDGDAYDAYGLAQEYEMKQTEKKEKAAKAEKAKAAKIARDQKMREQKRAAKEAHEKERD